MEEEDLRFIQDQIGYSFRNTDLLQQAFVRSSYAQENGGPDNEILEFIGDKVLDIVVIRYLTEKYGSMTEDYDDYDPEEEFNEFYCDKSEGELTDLKRRLVEKKNLATRIDQLGLAEYLIMGKSDIQHHVEQEMSVKEDLFEAILGAIAIDSDWNFELLQECAELMLEPDSKNPDPEDDNYVELIQEWTEKKENRIPWFHYEKASYQVTWYDGFRGITQNIPLGFADHSKLNHHCYLKLSDQLPVFRGFGPSYSEARKAVCKLAYEYLEKHDLLWSIQDEIENPDRMEAINQLEILARRGYFSLPVYDFRSEYDHNGNPVWHCKCHIPEYQKFFCSEDSSKKNAKKTVAYKMLQYVLK